MREAKLFGERTLVHQGTTAEPLGEDENVHVNYAGHTFIR